MFRRKSKDFTIINIGASLHHIYPLHYGLILLLLIILAGTLLLFGLFMPILTFHEMKWFKQTFSVLSGVANLWDQKQPILALIIVLFSVIFPTLKLFTLFWLWLAKLTSHQRVRIMERLELLGKWSMLDVFVVEVTVVTVKLGFLINAMPRVGIYVFGSSIILTMFIMLWLEHLGRKVIRPHV